VGKVNKAQYKVVLQEKTVAPGGRHVEILGSYDPHSKQAVLKDERIKYWIEKGAQLSDTVHNLFASKGLIAEKKRPVKMPKKVEEAKPEEAKTEAPVAENKPVEEVKLETKVEAPVAEVKPEEPEAEEVKKRRS